MVVRNNGRPGGAALQPRPEPPWAAAGERAGPEAGPTSAENKAPPAAGAAATGGGNGPGRGAAEYPGAAEGATRSRPGQRSRTKGRRTKGTGPQGTWVASHRRGPCLGRAGAAPPPADVGGDEMMAQATGGPARLG